MADRKTVDKQGLVNMMNEWSKQAGELTKGMEAVNCRNDSYFYGMATGIMGCIELLEYHLGLQRRGAQ